MDIYLSSHPPKPENNFPNTGAMILIALFAGLCVTAIAMMVSTIYSSRHLEGRYRARDLDGGYALVLIGEKGYKKGDWVITHNDTIVTISNVADTIRGRYATFEIISPVDDNKLSHYMAVELESSVNDSIYKHLDKPFALVLKGEAGYKVGQHVWASEDIITTTLDTGALSLPYEIIEVIQDKE